MSDRHDLTGSTVSFSHFGAIVSGKVLQSIGDKRVHRKLLVEFFDPHWGKMSEWLDDTKVWRRVG